MRSGMFGVFLLLLVATGCASHGAAVPASPSASSTQMSLPSGARPDLPPKWVDHGKFVWPPDDGFAAAPVAMILPAGMLLDRFGSDYGQFLSPKGAPFSARALPYMCEAADYKYNVYRVAAPLLVWAGKAKAWFDQQGGATQFETDAPVVLLLADHILEPVAAPSENPATGIDRT